MRISVALAYYRGEQYIREQLQSILPQLSLQDEVVISVDDITERGKNLLRSLQEGDDRIRIIRGPGKGVVRNFERAIKACRGDIIFLCDQDDMWTSDKVSRVMEAFEDPEVSAVLHNAVMIDGKGNLLHEPSLFEFRGSKTGFLKNLVRNSYIGCCMAFRKGLVSLICPIPKEMYMHDYWIGMAAEKTGRVVLIEEPLLYYRRHGFNVTDLSHGKLGFMLTKRINMVRCLRLLDSRIHKLNIKAVKENQEVGSDDVNQENEDMDQTESKDRQESRSGLEEADGRDIGGRDHV